jgi:hypothetical protein
VKIAVEELCRAIPPGQPFILVDDDTIGVRHLGDRPRRQFLEREGLYWGPPADDDTAIRELRRERETGAGFLVFAWPSFWWLDHYSAFHRYLTGAFPCLLANERLVIFDLRDRTRPAGAIA